MASNSTRRDVELRINANDLSEKTLQQLLDTFDKLRASQEALAKSGDGTQRSVRELKQDLVDLQAVATELKSRAALVDQFLAIEKRATEAAKRVDSAKEALQKFNAAQVQGAEATKKEQAEFARLSKEVTKAEKSLTTSTAKLEEFRTALSQIGAGDTNTTREALLRFSTDLGASLATAEQSIRRYDAALRESQQREKAAADAKREAAKAAAELKQAQDALSSSVAFNKQGRDALAAASNVEVLTRDYDKLAATSRKAGDGIREIIDPSRQALTSLNGLETEIKQLNGQLDSLQAGPKLGDELKQIRAQYNAFAADAGRAAASLVDDIGAYKKAEESLAALRSRIEAAQQSVREFASQMAVASDPSEKLARDLAAAQAKLKGFDSEFDREARALANLRVRLREAGVDVNNLADAQTRLAGVASGVVQSQRKIEEATARVAKFSSDNKVAEEARAAKEAFNQLGRDAVKAANGIEVLSRDYDALAASSRKAGDGVRAIIDPSRQAMSTLGGLEAETKKLNDQLQKAASSATLREEVRKLRSEYGSLATDAGKAAASLGDDIGAYRQAEQAVGTLRAKLEQAQQSVRAFGEQMAKADGPTDELAKSLAAAKSQLNTLAADYDRQSAALAKLRAALRDAGVATDKLTEAEKRLGDVARGVVRAQEALGVASVKVGANANQAASGLKLFEDHGRKALSSAQRLRGEILSLASSYLGLFAAINVAKGAVNVAVSRESTLRQLELLTGSADAAKAKLEEVSKKTEEMGLVSLPAAAQYAKFALSMKAAGVAADEADRAFFDALTIGKNTSLTADQLDRFNTALHQMATLGRVGAEELNQAADAGVNLRAAIADAMKLSASEFKKDSEAGLLGVNALIAGLRKLAADTSKLKKNDKSVIDSLRAFEQGVNNLKIAIADSGFLDTLVKLIQKFSESVKKGEFNAAIQGFGEALKFAGEMAIFLLEHFTAVMAVVITFIGLNVGKLFLDIAVSMKTLGIGAGVARVAVLGLTVAFRGLTAALGFLAAHPLVALITLIGYLVLKTEAGRGALNALWQIVVEFGGALGDLLRLDFAGFATRVEGSMGRVKAAFKIAKDKAQELEDTAEGKSKKPSRISSGTVGGGAEGSWEPKPDHIDLAERELTANTAKAIDEDLAEMQTALAKERAKTVHNTEAEVRAEYQKTQDKIDEMVVRGKKTQNQATLDQAAKRQEALNKTIAAIAAERTKRKKAEEAEAAHKGAVAEALEEAKQRAEVTKEGLRLERAVLEQNYKEGKLSLEDYYAQRLDLTKRGLKAELDAAKEQKAIWEKELKRGDPKALKPIAKLEGVIKGNAIEKDVAVRESDMELAERQKALRGQMNALRQELSLLTGDYEQAELRDIQNWYEGQLENLKDLTGAARERALAELNTAVALKMQNVALATRRKAAQEKLEMAHLTIDTQVAKGELSELQELDARSKANQEYLKVLEAEATQLRINKQEGTDAYKTISLEIERLKGQTDLLDIKLTGLFKEAASGAVDELFHEDKEGLDRLQRAQQALVEFNRQQQLGVEMTEKQRAEYARLTEEVDKASKGMESRTERALKSFSKTMGKAIVKSFTDELATSLVKMLKDSGIFNFVKSIFSGMMTRTGHTGAVIGHGGGVPKRVSPLAFLGAPRYHSGGLPGLRRDEVAFIGLKGEEVLSRDDPRNVLNAGKNPPGAASGPLFVQLHPDAMGMTLRDWLQSELARVGATQ